MLIASLFGYNDHGDMFMRHCMVQRGRIDIIEGMCHQYFRIHPTSISYTHIAYYLTIGICIYDVIIILMQLVVTLLKKKSFLQHKCQH
jgi:hypothetical protein